jgi:hypothetical protein
MANAAITVDLNARIAQFESEIKKATGSLDKFEKRGAQLASGLKSAFGAIGSGLTAGAFVAFTKSIIDAGDELDKLAKRANLTVKDMASLQLIAEQSDTDLDTLTKGVQRLSVSMAEAQGGNKELAKALRDLGVTAKDPFEALFQLADATKKSSDSSKTNADLMKVLSRSYGELLPMLREGGEGWRDAAKSSERYAQAMAGLSPVAAAFNDNISALRTQLKTTISEGMTPFVKALNDIADAYVNASNSSEGMSTWGERFGNALKGIIIVSEAFITVFKDVANTVYYGSAAIGAAIAGQFSRAKDFVVRLGLAYRETGENYKKFAHAVAVGVDVSKFAPSGVNRGDQGAQLACIADGGSWDGRKCNRIKTGGGRSSRASDPLAGLIGQTDIGRLREFEKTVAQLNDRFNYGKKDPELYAQAMTKVVESTFSNNFRQAAEDAEFMNVVIADGQTTINEANQNMRDWEQTVADTQRELLDMIDPVNALVRQLSKLDKFDGYIDPEILAAARLKINAQIDALGSAKEKVSELNTFAEQAARNIQDAFADFLFDPFDKGIKGMLDGFIDMIRRMLAEAAAAKLGKELFGDFASGGSSGDKGFLGNFLDTGLAWLLSANGNAFAGGRVQAFASGGILGPAGGVLTSPTLFPMANGFGLAGEAGTEAVMPLKRGKNGKLGVQADSGGHLSVVMNINTPDANSFRASEGQITAQMTRALQRGRRYM